MEHSEEYFEEYAESLKKEFRALGGIADPWPHDPGSIVEFLDEWNGDDITYRGRDVCSFTILNANGNVAEQYMVLTRFRACEDSAKWLDKEKPLTTYLRGTYACGCIGRLKFLVMIQQKFIANVLYCRVSVACHSIAIARVVAEAYLLYKIEGYNGKST